MGKNLLFHPIIIFLSLTQVSTVPPELFHPAAIVPPLYHHQAITDIKPGICSDINTLIMQVLPTELLHFNEMFLLLGPALVFPQHFGLRHPAYGGELAHNLYSNYYNLYSK